jgi:hypothetical protein
MAYPLDEHVMDKLPENPFARDQQPPTKAQVLYWRELCQAVADKQAEGMADDAWPADIAPSSLTVRILVDRHLLVRRERAWHVRRDWQDRFLHLQAIAVPTPLLQTLDRPAPDLPTYAEMEAWESVLLWLDAQPQRRARLPFAPFDESVCPLLGAMRRYRLVRLAQPSCYWVLSPHWQERFLALWQATLKAEGDAPAREAQPHDPVSLVAGIDTWYLNRIDEDGLPVHLRQELDAYQQQAKAGDAEVDTGWVFDGVPLKMYRAGVSAAQGGGASWAYLLRNGSLTLRIRRKPLGGIIAQVQFASECLWRLTPLEALNQLDRFIKGMWGQTRGQWQNSQVHLCHDVMHASIELEQLDRYVSRSRTQAVFDAAHTEIEQIVGHGADTQPGLDWNEVYGGDEGFFGDPLFALGEEMDLVAEPVEERQVSLYRWGRRLSGVAWSQGGDISLVQYLKTLEMQRTGKRHMVPLWEAQGYTGTEPVVRYEARLRRGALRALKVAGCARDALDNPWTFLEHLQDVWALVVGQAYPTPDASGTAWLRRVVPNGDTNRARWPTDPTWKVVQAATFTPASLEVRRLLREEQQSRDRDLRVRTMYGALVSLVALTVPAGERWDVSHAVRQIAPLLVEEAEVPGKEFGELVRERKRRFNLPVQQGEKILPFRPASAQEDRPDPTELDQEPTGDFERAWWHMELAERRMREVLDALDQAKQRGVSLETIADLETAYQHEVGVRDAALRLMASEAPLRL